MASYLEAVQVAVGDEEQKAETRSKVERFLSADGVGPKLQQLLIEKQSKEDNWVLILDYGHYITQQAGKLI
jgi:hypothetical protein